MSGKGRRVVFHGAFSEKAKAERKEARVRGAYLRRVELRSGGRRWLVLTRRKG